MLSYYRYYHHLQFQFHLFQLLLVKMLMKDIQLDYHLKQLQPELKIAIFEKEYVGFGASGRNGGWASAEYPTSSKRLIKEHGLDSYKQLRTALINSIDEIGQIASLNKWQIDYAKGGSLLFATNKPQLTRISAEIDDEHQLLSKAQVKETYYIKPLESWLWRMTSMILGCTFLYEYDIRLYNLISYFLYEYDVLPYIHV